MPRGCFVTATDTGVGKTVLTAAIAASLRAAGEPVRVRKPVITGLDEADVVPDHVLLATVTGEAPETVSTARFGPPVSPHLAAALAGSQIDVPELVEALREDDGATMLVEGIGGLLVPLAEGWDVREFAREVGLGVVIAARPGVGTISHTLLTLEAARHGGLDVRAVVLTPWPGEPTDVERSNVETIERLGDVEVATLRTLREMSVSELADAGDALPYARWLR